MNTFEPQKLHNENIKEIIKIAFKIMSYGKYNFIPFIIFFDILLGVLLTSYSAIPVYNLLINLLAGPIIIFYFTFHIETIRQIKDNEKFSVTNLLHKSILLLKENFFYIKKYIFYYYIFTTIIFILSLPLFYHPGALDANINDFYHYISKICIGSNMFFFFCFIFENKARSHSLLFNSLNIMYNNCNEAQSNMMIEKSSKLNEKKLSLIKIWTCIITIVICLKLYILFPFFVIFSVAFQFSLWDYIFNNNKGLKEMEEEASIVNIDNEGVIQG